MNEINKLVWPNPYGIGVMTSRRRSPTRRHRQDRSSVTKKLPQGAVTYRLATGPEPAETASVDIYGNSYKPITVKVTAGGK